MSTAVARAFRGQSTALVYDEQLPASAGAAPVKPELDPCDAAGEARQDRYKVGPFTTTCHLPAGEGRGGARDVRGDPAMDYSAADGRSNSMRLAAESGFDPGPAT